MAKKKNSQRTVNKQNKAKRTDTKALTKLDKKLVKKGNEKAVTKYVQEAPNKGGFNWARPLGMTLVYFALALALFLSPVDIIPDVASLSGFPVGHIDDIGYFVFALVFSVFEWKKSVEKLG
ncbi:MAG: DUF1232 domain-containing protein [Clostridia bacterium]|nr:DUF1232 domain-containing protein [Clostridia bacterium]